MPRLLPQMPCYGYDLGMWNDHLEHRAQLAVKSEYWETGKWCARHRRSDVRMNTELRTLEDAPGRGGRVRARKKK